MYRQNFVVGNQLQNFLKSTTWAASVVVWSPTTGDSSSDVTTDHRWFLVPCGHRPRVIPRPMWPATTGDSSPHVTTDHGWFLAPCGHRPRVIPHPMWPPTTGDSSSHVTTDHGWFLVPCVVFINWLMSSQAPHVAMKWEEISMAMSDYQAYLKLTTCSSRAPRS